ncbi:MAG TPA: class I SAM-dependent methyltransferase [Steroidobacteraceae bacterium]|nr:class I SAM-dependent methyltransferase [Steroidobacteraceae bacterium]
MTADLYMPTRCVHFGEDDAWRWYANIAVEMANGELSEDAQMQMRTYYLEAGLLRRMRQRFFRRHFVLAVSDTIQQIFATRSTPRILDLGCGLGTQSILFAALGAKVIALDLDARALQVLRERIKNYERKFGRTLAIDVQVADSLTFDYSMHSPIDAVFSMFAFNMMQPSELLVRRILDGCAADADICILDGNNESWLARLVPSRRRKVWSPDKLRERLSELGFDVVRHGGGVSLPPAVWNVRATKLLTTLDDRLNRSWLAPVSYFLIARRRI